MTVRGSRTLIGVKVKLPAGAPRPLTGSVKDRVLGLDDDVYNGGMGTVETTVQDGGSSQDGLIRRDPDLRRVVGAIGAELQPMREPVEGDTVDDPTSREGSAGIGGAG